MNLFHYIFYYTFTFLNTLQIKAQFGHNKSSKQYKTKINTHTIQKFGKSTGTEYNLEFSLWY